MKKLAVGDRVTHIQKPILGHIMSIDYGTETKSSYNWLTYHTTTCLVQWDNAPEGNLDLRWLDELEIYDEDDMHQLLTEAFQHKGKIIDVNQIESWLSRLAD